VNLIASEIVDRARKLAGELASLPESERIEALNDIRAALHDVSPFADEPVECVLWVPADRVRANDYNPNKVAPPEMRLLEHSIASDGYTQPIVTHDDGDGYTVVDGFHRNRVGKESPKVRKRLRGYLPIVRIRASQADTEKRMASTIRHNRARGKHAVEPMTGIVVYLAKKGWDDEKIGRELGMDPSEVLRYKQITGLAELFKDREFSQSWEIA
jgi:ParB-like chromosome segregation protein Spo0J